MAKSLPVKGVRGFRTGPVVPYRPPVNLVLTVLVLAALASAALCFFGLMLMSGERAQLKRMRELHESGIEVRAELVSLVPFGTRGYARVVYEWQSPEGSGRHTQGANMGHAHVVGRRYPLVFDPRNTKRAHLGTQVAVRRECKRLERQVRHMRRMALASFLTGALATAGLVISP